MEMSQEVYSKLQKGKSKFLKYLYGEEIKRSWFISYHIADYEDEYISLFMASWENAVKFIIDSTDPLPTNFREILYVEMLKLTIDEPENDYDDLSDDIGEPYIDSKYQMFVEGINLLEKEKRTIYLLSTFGGVRPKQLGIAFKKSENQMKEYIAEISSQAQNTPKIKKLNGATAIILSTQFRSIGGSAFESIEVPRDISWNLDKRLCELVKTKERHFFKKHSKNDMQI